MKKHMRGGSKKESRRKRSGKHEAHIPGARPPGRKARRKAKRVGKRTTHRL